MKKKDNKNQYKPPQIGKFVSAVCDEYKLNTDEVAKFLLKKFPELSNKAKCANCNASMSQYEHSIDSIDALLLLGMGKIVGQRAKTMPFTKANAVHVQSELNRYYSVASRTSWCSKLGLITKVKHKDGSHDQKAGWLITRRGFEFLAGKPVPRKVMTFRNEIVERFEGTITFGEILKGVTRTPEGAELSKHGEYKFDKLEAWAIVGFAQGKLL